MYNPVAGKRVDIRSKLTEGLKEAGIQCELYETRGLKDAIQYAMTFEIDNYAAIGGVGGDGTIYEIVNGMLKRED